LRHRDNIAKRVLIHSAGFNLGLLMRVSYGLIKPRRLSDAARGAILLVILAYQWLCSLAIGLRERTGEILVRPLESRRWPALHAA
jgi:hypothetical protein